MNERDLGKTDEREWKQVEDNRGKKSTKERERMNEGEWKYVRGYDQRKNEEAKEEKEGVTYVYICNTYNYAQDGRKGKESHGKEGMRENGERRKRKGSWRGRKETENHRRVD